MARKTPKKELTFRDRLQSLLEAEAAMYDKENIVRQFVISFPNRQKAPLLGRIGARLVGMTGGVIQIKYDEIKQK
jgi:hypothetical protein